MDINLSPHYQKAALVAKLLIRSPTRARSVADRFVREGVPLTVINYCSSFIMYDLRERNLEKAREIASCFGNPYGWGNWLSTK